MIRFTIPVEPRTKKNHGNITCMFCKNSKKPCRKIPVLHPSKQYQKYEKDCRPFIPHPSFAPITGQVNVKATFFMGTRRKVDLVNLMQALLDIMVKYGLIEDDNSRVVVSIDGSRVAYDKERPRTEVEIIEIEKGDNL